MDDADAEPALRDDTVSVENKHGLIRHCSLEYCPPIRLEGGGFRIPSPAFRLRDKEKGEVYLSIDLEHLLLSDGLDPTHHVPKATHYAARLVAEVPRAEGLGVAPEPLKNNPHHGGIYGLLPLKGKPRERVQKALALRSVIIGLDV